MVVEEIKAEGIEVTQEQPKPEENAQPQQISTQENNEATGTVLQSDEVVELRVEEESQPVEQQQPEVQPQPEEQTSQPVAEEGQAQGDQLVIVEQVISE